MVTDCVGCGRICLALLGTDGTAAIEEIATKTDYSVDLVRVHIEHLLDSGRMQAAGDSKWRLMGVVKSEKPTR
jgi:hypothetical protein